MTEASKDLVRRLFDDVFNEQRLDLAEEILAEEYVDTLSSPSALRSPGRSMAHHISVVSSNGCARSSRTCE